MHKLKRYFRSGSVTAVVLAAAASSTVARGGGFSIYEAGSQATAMGGAFTAQANDGSAMFYNPAGLAWNDKLTVMVGDTLIFPDSKLDQGLTPFPGEGYSASQKKQIFFPPNFYVSYPLKTINISLGTWFPFGLSTAWEEPDTFRGRYLSQRVDLRQYSLGLQVSGKPAPWIAIAAGPELRLGDVKLQKNIGIFSPFANKVVDAAHVDIVSDGFEAKVTWGAGLLITPTKELRIGAAYHAHVDVDFKGKAVFYQIPTGNPEMDAAFASKIPVNVDVPVATTVQYPAVFMAGVSYDFGERVTLEGDVTYTSWRVFDQTVLSFSEVDGKQVPTSTLKHSWENTWTLRGGVKVKAHPKFHVMAGFLYDQTPQPDEDVSPLLPDANRTGASIGFSIGLGKDTHVDLSNLFLFFHDRTTTTNKDGFNGRYKTSADLLVLNIRTAF